MGHSHLGWNIHSTRVEVGGVCAHIYRRTQFLQAVDNPTQYSIFRHEFENVLQKLMTHGTLQTRLLKSKAFSTS